MNIYSILQYLSIYLKLHSVVFNLANLNCDVKPLFRQSIHMRKHILDTLLHSTTHFGDHFFYFHKEFTTIRTIQPAINLGLKFSYIYEEQSVIIVVTLYFLRDRINRKCLIALQVWVCLCAVSEYVRRITWHIIFFTAYSIENNHISNDRIVHVHMIGGDFVMD